MKKLLLTLVTLSTCILSGCAQNIPNIQDVDYPEFEYPIRKDAFVIVLQPVPDNSGDYTMTICNKESHCRQTSMLETEIRYIGLFLEDIKPVLSVELNRKLTKDEWDERQSTFRDMYADYMNMYDKTFGELQTVTPPGVKVNITGFSSQKLSDNLPHYNNPKDIVKRFATLENELNDFMAKNRNKEENSQVFGEYMLKLYSLRDNLFEIISYRSIKEYGISFEEDKQNSKYGHFANPRVNNIYVQIWDGFGLNLDYKYALKKYAPYLNESWNTYINYEIEENKDRDNVEAHDGDDYYVDMFHNMRKKWLKKWSAFIEHYPNFPLNERMKQEIKEEMEIEYGK